MLRVEAAKVVDPITHEYRLARVREILRERAQSPVIDGNTRQYTQRVYVVGRAPGSFMTELPKEWVEREARGMIPETILIDDSRRDLRLKLV